MESLGTKPKEMMDVMGAMKCGRLISSCCHRNPHGKAGNEERRRTRQLVIFSVIYSGVTIL